MSKNLMPEIAKLLGVEMGEAFCGQVGEENDSIRV